MADTRVSDSATAHANRPAAGFPADLLPLLGVPDFATLTLEQLAGRACIWGGRMLRLATSSSLCVHTQGDVYRYPRACGQSLADHAFTALAAPSINCAPCHDRDHWRDCPTGDGLHQFRVTALAAASGAC
ncbi:hypothetical protein [Streptomyces bauhiniae]|uniref:hypothetical protein n=1 Tax=Streptomyces bauhiniae TaxID=2340725 RepID=UPI0035DE51E6